MPGPRVAPYIRGATPSGWHSLHSGPVAGPRNSPIGIYVEGSLKGLDGTGSVPYGLRHPETELGIRRPRRRRPLRASVDTSAASEPGRLATAQHTAAIVPRCEAVFRACSHHLCT